MTPATRITVAGARPYDVVVGRDVLDRAPMLLPDGVTRLAIIRPEGLAAQASAVAEAVGAAGVDVHELAVPDGEAAKEAGVAAELWRRLGEAGFTRRDAVAGVGGGATTDLAGFVAATWLRGVPVLQVPTTLLAMVDAAVGGKTGINTPQGKNLVGSFHPPVGVLCDLDVLDGLPRADYIAGLAEVVKAGFIADTEILALVAADPQAAARPDGPHSRELVERAIAVKAAVVGEDLREQGRREILNYGHTLGHAIEREENYTYRHGYAVAVGMVFAAELARRSGLITDELVERHRRLLQAVGLPTRYDGAPWPRLRAAMRLDKKARGASQRFVVLRGPGDPTTLTDPDEELLAEAYAAVGG